MKPNVRYKDNPKEYLRQYGLINRKRLNKLDRLKREKKKEKYLEMEANYRKQNREKLNKAHREWSNKPENRLKQKKYREENKEKLNEYFEKRRRSKEYKEKFNIYYKEWINKRLKTDPHFKIKQQMSHRIYLALKSQRTKKSNTTSKLIGCSISKLWKHLEERFEPGMTRENHGTWHVDHIIPCASFDLTDPEQQKICFHYTNLQPMWALDNIKKGKKT